MNRILASITIPLVFAAVVHAQAGLTGKWQGETREMRFQIVLDLTAVGTALTGTLTRDGKTVAIADGKMSKNTFTFKATLDDKTEGVTGELAGDQITVWLDREGPSAAVVLKRVKPPAIAGTWKGETRNGSEIVLDLTATETILTGTIARNGQPTTIADGKVSKNIITFKATLNDRAEEFTGEVAGDQINVWLDRQGPSNAVVLRRVKN